VNTALKDLKRELEDARFSRAAFGYRSADVDNFMDELERKLDVAIAERDELVGLIEKLKNEILSLRSEKEAITRAIVNSEKIAQASVIDAGVKSKYILRDASEKAAKMMNSANDEYERKINEAKKTQ
jgi:cell division septum initiation protein DivIVA